jgi:hypothetical protein
MTNDAVPGVLPTSTVIDTLLKGLNAYDRLYGLPADLDQIQGILATLLRLDQHDRPAAAIDQAVQQVLAGLSVEAIRHAIVDRASSALAKQAHQWQQEIEARAKGVLAAYLDRYGASPTLNPETMGTVATAVLPLLGSDRPTTQAEALGLISRLVQTLAAGKDLDRDRPLGAIAAALSPDYLALAQKLAHSLSQKPMEEAVAETVTAYVKEYAPTLTTIGSDLISQALSAVLKNQVDFGIDVDLAMVDRDLLIQQVSFQLNILKASPPASKSAQAIAAEVNGAVKALEAHPDRPKPTDATDRLDRPGGASSAWTSTRPPKDSSASEDFWNSRA